MILYCNIRWYNLTIFKPSGSSLILLKSGKLVKAVGESCLSLDFEETARSRGMGRVGEMSARHVAFTCHL